MNVWLDSARELPPEAVAAIGAVAGFLAILAIAVQLAARRLRRQLTDVEEELVDARTGLLPRSALRVRLGAEIAWAATSHTPIAVAALRIRGSRFVHATHALRDAMREEESAFLLGDQQIAVELWDTSPEAAVGATRRLGEQLARAGHPVVDAGIASSPRDGSDVETLLAAAQRDLRPVDDPRSPGHALDASGRVRGAGRHAMALLSSTLVWFGATALLAFSAWRLIPAAVEPAISGSRTESGQLLALGTVVGVPLGAALLSASAWNSTRGPAPRSRPHARAGIRSILAIAAIVAAPVVWGAYAPDVPAEFGTAFGAGLASIALILLALTHARQLVHANPIWLAVLLLVGCGITWAAVEVEALPLVANAGRLLAGAALGALLASFVERASWLVGLSLLAAGVDVWSVVAETGVSRQLLDGGSASGDRIVELLLFTGPSVNGAPLFELGATDLVFLALYLAWSHDWRIDLRLAGAALLGAVWSAFVIGQLVDEPVPVLPFLAGAMVALLVMRGVLLRSRSAGWRAAADAMRDR